MSTRICRQILTAGGKNQVVADGGYRRHSVFTGYLIKAIDDGVADFNKDGWITFNELVTYLIHTASSKIQTPGYATLPGHEQGEFLFRSVKTFVSKRPIESNRLPDVVKSRDDITYVPPVSFNSKPLLMNKEIGVIKEINLDWKLVVIKLNRKNIVNTEDNLYVKNTNGQNQILIVKRVSGYDISAISKQDLMNLRIGMSVFKND